MNFKESDLVFCCSYTDSPFGLLHCLMELRLVHTKRLRHRQRNVCYIDGQNGHAIHSAITVPIKNIKGAARQCYRDFDRVVRCEQTIRIWFSSSSVHSIGHVRCFCCWWHGSGCLTCFCICITYETCVSERLEEYNVDYEIDGVVQDQQDVGNRPRDQRVGVTLITWLVVGV